MDTVWSALNQFDRYVGKWVKTAVTFHKANQSSSSELSKFLEELLIIFLWQVLKLLFKLYLLRVLFS